MNSPYGHANSPHRRDPLGHEYEFALHRLDAQLDDLAARDEAPEGLTDRVYEISVRMLPGAEVRAAERTRQRLASIGERPRRRSALVLHRTAWGRLAAAASLAIVSGAAVWLSMSNPARLAHQDRGVAAVEGNGEFSLAGDWLPMDSTSQLEYEVALLLDTTDITETEVLGGLMAWGMQAR